MNIYISNLSKGVTEESLRGSFEHLGIVEHVKIVFAADDVHQKDFAVITLSPISKPRHYSSVEIEQVLAEANR
jgi:RNA recognition motif-containing protein